MPLTPITDLDPAQCNLAAQIHEYAQPERIGLNLPHLGRIAAWGGFYRDQITIKGVRGETSSYEPTIVGGAGHGYALMGAVVSKVAELGTGVPGERSSNDWRSRTSLTLEVNTSELYQRVQDSGPSIEPANWARHINHALASGLRQAAWRNLAGVPPPFVETLVTGILALGVTSANTTALLSRPDFGGVAVATAAAAMLLPNFFRFLDYNHPKSNRSVRDTCFSIIPVVHLDRLAMVSGLSRAIPVARAIKG